MVFSTCRLQLCTCSWADQQESSFFCRQIKKVVSVSHKHTKNFWVASHPWTTFSFQSSLLRMRSRTDPFEWMTTVKHWKSQELVHYPGSYSWFVGHHLVTQVFIIEFEFCIRIVILASSFGVLYLFLLLRLTFYPTTITPSNQNLFK